jgi:hypothetical protein
MYLTDYLGKAVGWIAPLSRPGSVDDIELGLVLSFTASSPVTIMSYSFAIAGSGECRCRPPAAQCL